MEDEIVSSNELVRLLDEAKVRQLGHVVLSSYLHSYQKLEFDNVRDHPEALKTVLDKVAEKINAYDSDLLLGVPYGGQWLAEKLITTGRLNLPLAYLERPQKYLYMIASPEDEKKILKAERPMIFDDVVTTLGQMGRVAELVKNHKPDIEEIRGVAVWLRGDEHPDYKNLFNSIDYLIEEKIPHYTPLECPSCTGKNIPEVW